MEPSRNKFCFRLLPRIALSVAILCVGAAAKAAPMTILRNEITYSLKADATYSYEEFASMRINDAQAVTQLGQIPLLFSESLQTIEILEAYTTTKDGQRIDVAPDKMLLQQLPASADAPMFSDRKQKVIVFPQVEVGSVITFHFRRTQLKPELPGVFSMREVFSKTNDYKGAELTVRAPASMKLQLDNSGVQGGEVKTTQSGNREWHWTLAQTADIPAEPGSVSMDDVSPFVAATNLKNYDELAKAYLLAAKPAAKITPAIRQQANEITQGISDKRAQAEALYRWVSGNIRYVAIFMNVGGYVPHEADAILQARYGDCKDHVTLLEALLAAKGIKSSPVLVNALNSYVLPKVAVMSAFNHAITYLPDYQLFVDSTSGFGRFGELSDGTSGKTVLVADAGNAKPSLMSTPLIGDKADRISINTVANIGTDGAVTGKNSVQLGGVYELVHRAILGSMPKQQIPQIANVLLARAGQQGNGNLLFGDARDLSQPFTYEAEFQLPNRVPLPGPGAFTDAAGISSPLGIASFAFGTAAVPERKLPFPCVGGMREEVTQFTLPDNLKISSLPKAAKVTSKFGSYESTYVQESNKITVKRKLDLVYPQATCNSADYVEIKAMASAVSQDLRAQYLYQ